MSFSPVIPSNGYTGWVFLQRTYQKQAAAFSAAPQIRRDEDYFREKIGSIKNADELVNDRRLLKVALEAFGLGDQVDSKFFIKKILEEGANERGSFANRLADPAYRKLSGAFGFDQNPPKFLQEPSFVNKTLESYKERQFAVAVGEQDNDMRLALNAKRELTELTVSNSSEKAKWFTILGSTPLRKVFEKMYGLPSSFGSIDIEKQVEILEDRTRSAFGDSSVSQLKDPDKLEKLVRGFLLRSQIDSFGFQSSQEIALTLLQS